jgi:hypothetical protein
MKNEYLLLVFHGIKTGTYLVGLRIAGAKLLLRRSRNPRHPSELVGVVQHDPVFIHGKLCSEATPVEILEEIEAVGQPCIGLCLRMNRQVRPEDPSHAELPPLTDSHRLAENREAVGEWSRPDINIQAAIEVVDGLPIAVSPVTLSICLQTKRSGKAGRGEHQLGIVKPPRFVPAEPIRKPERIVLFVEREDNAVGKVLCQE